MAEQDYLPDQWSDHDFFVVTIPGQQEAFRTDLSWLPNHQRIAFWFRDSPHALRAVFDSGHLLEFVLFDEAELAAHGQINRYRVLLDRSDVTRLAAEVAERTRGLSRTRWRRFGSRWRCWKRPALRSGECRLSTTSKSCGRGT